ncbi:MAG: DUF4139 domain-containing protein [Deltaproteobacteria bacterium]
MPWLAALSVALGCAKPAVSPSSPNVWPAAQQRSDASSREHVALTVYDSNFALVREERRLHLGRGRIALAYADVSEQIEPATVHLQALDAPGDLVVLEQNYQYDLLTPQTLLEKYLGRKVALARYDGDEGADVRREAQVLASARGPVLAVNGEVTSLAPDERVIFPELPPGLLPEPTLVWLLDSARQEQRVEVSYLTKNLSWRADYVLSLAADNAHADLTGWVTLDNQTGTSFPGAALQLVAGDVHRAAPAPVLGGAAGSRRRLSKPKPAFVEQPLFEYHLYALERPTDVLAREQKQVQLLEVRGIAVEKKLVLRAPRLSVPRFVRAPQPGQTSPLEHARIVVVIENREASGLGMPLPRGVVRAYREDARGAAQFVGEDSIQHTPRDERLEIELGAAFDVVAERRRLQQRQLERCVQQSEWRIALRNHQDAAVVVEVVESASGDWQVLESTLPAERRNAISFAFVVPVPARGATELGYQLRTRTCD